MPQPTDFLKRTWAQIRLDAIQQNYRTIAASLSSGSRIMAVVKADAYGHGACWSARALREAGATWFGVSNLDEALQLRSAGITEPILILAYTPPEEAARLAAFSITQTILTREYAAALSAQAQKAGVHVRAHVKLDTGMSRIGLLYQHSGEQETLDDIEAICHLPHVTAEGIFTHFASADETEGDAYTRQQFALFMEALSRLEQRGIRFSLRHCCNSAATLRYPEMHLDMVRPGIILYGLAPAAWMEGILPLEPAMELKTVISMIKRVPPHTPVSYGRTFSTGRQTAVATVPIGYADGYPRCLSNRAHMLVGGQKAPVIGRICMDQCMLDVTGIDAQEGMLVTVFGKDGSALLPVEEFAALSGTINYETVCLIGKRVPRIFLNGNEAVGRLNYITPEH